MAYNNKTFKEIYDLLIENLQEKFNRELRLLPKSFIVVLAKVVASVAVIPYKLCGWLYLQMFPDTAYFGEVDILGSVVNPLVKLGVQFGIGEPRKGTAWGGSATATAVTTGSVIADGTQLKNKKNGLLYLVSGSRIVDAESVSFRIYCTVSGGAGNLQVGDELEFVSPLGFVLKTVTVDGVENVGSDDETEASYRRRIVERYRAQPMGGALADYRNWGLEVPGVAQIYPYASETHGGHVLLYVAGDESAYPDRTVDRGLCVQVGEACTYDPESGIANRKPITAILDPEADGSYSNVMSVSIVTFDVKVTGIRSTYIADFGEAFKGALEVFLKSKEPWIRGLSNDGGVTDIISTNSIIAEADRVAGLLKISFESVELLLDSSYRESYTLAWGQLARLGNLYINGEIYG